MIYNTTMTNEVYKSYPSSLDGLAKRLKGRTFSPSEYYIVLTPDRYTQSVEGALFSGGGAIDCEVLTLSRLSRRLVKNGKILSREGGVMITARAISAVKDKLEYYTRAAAFNDFAREVYNTLLQISSSDVDVTEIELRGAAGLKIHDLALIKNQYDIIKAEYMDSPDRLTALIEAIPSSELIKNSHVYAVGYSDVTKLNARVFGEIKKYAKSFEYLTVEHNVKRRKSAEVFGAPDRISQYKEIAVRILDYVHSGGAFGDIAVICPSPRPLARILREYDIPFYADESVALYDTPPLTALCDIYKLKTSADGETAAALCKNPFSGVNSDDAEKLQDYLIRHGINYGIFDKTISDEGAARAVRRAKKLTELFVGSFADACEAIISGADFEGVQNTLYCGATDMITPILSLTALLRRYGADDFDTAAASFFSAARAVEVKSLPRERNVVTVTMPQSLRMRECGMLFVADFNEGILPPVISDSGLINDDELKSMGGLIEPSVREQNRRERRELFDVIQNAKTVVCTYSTAGGGRASSFIGEIAEKLTEYKEQERASVLLNSDDPQFISRYACRVGAAREIVSRAQSKHGLSISAAVGKSDTVAHPVQNSINIEPKKTVSVSELTHWFKCPYKRFLSDCVGVKERRTSALGAPDFGIVVHEFMERLLKQTPLDCSRENVERIMKTVLDQKEIYTTDGELSRLVDDATDYAAANVAVIQAGKYSPELFEHQFGGEMYFGNAQTKFVGVIDRVDVCGNRARIIDYKTFNKKFKIKDCLNGTDMQLPLYAAAVGKEGKDVTGMFYVPLSARYDNKNKPMAGCVVKDVDVAMEYDERLSDLTSSEIMSVQLKREKNGDLSFNNRMSAPIDGETFDKLIDKCVDTASAAADEIAGGYIARSPVSGACDSCAYFGICTSGKTVRGESDDAEDGE